ncbi:MAG: ABC transporter substrate-binding protein [Candidatus Hydrothermae bacterium]|nr:ABC transporter substrate-binding protein [Candidatus Hydrothermae bacterium]
MSARLLAVVNTVLFFILIFILIRPQIQARSQVSGKIAYALTPYALPIWVAADNGYFDSLKVDVALDLQIRRADEVELVANGASQFSGGTLFETFIPAIVRRAHVYRLFTVFQSTRTEPQTALIARRGIRKPTDLKGKRVGYWDQTRDDELLRQFLEAEGIPPRSVSLIPLTFTEIAHALEKNRVDAVLAYEPWRTYYQQQKGVRVLEDGFLENRLHTPLLLGTLYTSMLNLQLNRAATDRIGRALNMALSFIRSNPDSARNILVRHLLESDSTLTVPDSFPLPKFQTYRELEPSILKAFVQRLREVNLLLVEEFPTDSLIPPAELFR